MAKSKSFQTTARKTVARSGRIPGYHSRLPSVFPYHKKVSLEEALALSGVLVQAMTEGDGESLWFALTGHPLTVGGHVTLWLSSDAAGWLIGAELINDVLQYDADR